MNPARLPTDAPIHSPKPNPKPPPLPLRAWLLDPHGQSLEVLEVEPAERPGDLEPYRRILVAAVRAHAVAIELELPPAPPSTPTGEELQALWRLGRAAGLLGVHRVRCRRPDGEASMVLTLELQRPR